MLRPVNVAMAVNDSVCPEAAYELVVFTVQIEVRSRPVRLSAPEPPVRDSMSVNVPTRASASPSNPLESASDSVKPTGAVIPEALNVSVPAPPARIPVNELSTVVRVKTSLSPAPSMFSQSVNAIPLIVPSSM